MTTLQFLIKFFVLYLFVIFTSCHAAPEIKKNTLIRDAEIESILKLMMTPLFKAAGLDSKDLRLFIVATNEINAAASLNFSIFINTGLIIKSQNVGQLIGVLAHETGHIAGSHIIRTQESLQKSSLLAMASTVLGVAALAAGSGDAGMGLILGGNAMAQGNYLHYSRGQEAVADQIALRLLNTLKWPAIGLKEFFDYLNKQEYYSLDRRDAYLFTHPLSSERINLVQDFLSKQKNHMLKFPDNFSELYDRMVAKVFAYTSSPIATFLKYPKSDTSFAGRYARTIAHYRNNEVDKAFVMLSELISDNNADAYLYELKGQWLFEIGHIYEACEPLRYAHKLVPSNGLIHLTLLQVENELECKSPHQVIKELETIKQTEQENPQLWHLLAVAYGKLGDEGRAALALAEKAIYQDDNKQAYKQVKRALHFLKDEKARKSAQDLLNQLKLTPDSE